MEQHNQQLLTYVQHQRALGDSLGLIYANLIEAGWQEDVIEAVLDDLKLRPKPSEDPAPIDRKWFGPQQPDPTTTDPGPTTQPQ